jgi:proline dehydrogenase
MHPYQFYRHAALSDMKKAFEEVTGKGCFFAAKFVRGAYMEKERERAEEYGYQDPIQIDKKATDRDYDLAQEFAIKNIDKYSICSGTHNENSNAKLAALMLERGISPDDERVYFSQLLGMSDNISFKLSKEGFNVAKYVPYGPVDKVLPYLFRRAEENTSIAGQTGREFSLVKKEVKRRKSIK